jgi:DNA-binding PadR family transcriptional regulator
MDLNEFYNLGRLSEKGFLKERFNKEIDDLDYKLTEKGIKEIKTLLKDKNWRETFKKMILEQSRQMEDEEKIIFLENIIRMLKNDR